MTKMIQTFKSSALNVLLRDVHSNCDRSQNEKLISREREREKNDNDTKAVSRSKSAFTGDLLKIKLIRFSLLT